MLKMHAQTDSRTVADQTADQLCREGQMAGVVEAVVWNVMPATERADQRYVIAVEQ